MHMEAAAVDKLVEKGRFQHDVAQAIAESVDITIKASNLVTLPMLEARLAASDLRMEARFGAIEKSIEATKAWVTYLYAGLVVALFSTLAVDHHWLVNREDQLIAQLQARTDQRLEQIDQQLEQVDQRFAQIDQRLELLDQRFAQMRAQQDEILHQLRNPAGRVVAKRAATKQPARVETHR